MRSDVNEEDGGVGEVGREGVRGDGGERGSRHTDHGKSRVFGIYLQFIDIILHMTSPI